MSIVNRLFALEDRCQAAGVKIEAVCKRAGIDYSTYWRWKNEQRMPRIDAWENFTAAVDALCEEAAA